jgi:hypothetical protein
MPYQAAGGGNDGTQPLGSDYAVKSGGVEETRYEPRWPAIVV